MTEEAFSIHKTEKAAFRLTAFRRRLSATTFSKDLITGNLLLKTKNFTKIAGICLANRHF